MCFRSRLFRLHTSCRPSYTQPSLLCQQYDKIISESIGSKKWWDTQNKATSVGCALVCFHHILHINSTFQWLSKYPSYTSTQVHIIQKETKLMAWRSKLTFIGAMWRFWLFFFGSRITTILQNLDDRNYICSVPKSCLKIYQKACTYATWRPKLSL